MVKVQEEKDATPEQQQSFFFPVGIPTGPVEIQCIVVWNTSMYVTI